MKKMEAENGYITELKCGKGKVNPTSLAAEPTFLKRSCTVPQKKRAI